MWMPSIASKCASQPRPVGQMIETTYPASRSAPASCHTRRSNGDGRFSTSIRTRFALIRFQVAPLDMQGDEAGGTLGAAADPQRGGRTGERIPVHRLESVPGVVVARAVAL